MSKPRGDNFLKPVQTNVGVKQLHDHYQKVSMTDLNTMVLIFLQFFWGLMHVGNEATL